MRENTEYGYIQKANRYHWEIEGFIHTEAGFKSKQDCKQWIEQKEKECGIDWTVGFMIKFLCEDVVWKLVDKKGNDVSYA